MIQQIRYQGKYVFTLLLVIDIRTYLKMKTNRKWFSER